MGAEHPRRRKLVNISRWVFPESPQFEKGDEFMGVSGLKRIGSGMALWIGTVAKYCSGESF